MKPNITIIILNWNGWADTIECLESIYQIDYTNYNVILVDNGSEDNSIQKIRDFCKGKLTTKSKFFQYSLNNKPINLKEYSKKEIKMGRCDKKELSENEIILLKNEVNHGFAEGNNIGIKFAMKTFDPKYVLLLNNDTVVKKDFLLNLVNCAKITQSDILQPKIKYYEDLTLQSTGIKLDFFGFTVCRGDYEIDSYQYDTYISENFFYAAGACLLLKKEFLMSMGDEYFDKKLFAYHEDVDICWQARLFGFKIGYCPSSICYHKGSKSTGGTQSTGGAHLKKAYWVWRNRIRVIIKNYSFKNLIIALPLTIIIEFVTSIFVSINKKEFKYFLMFIKSLIWNIINFGDTFKRRTRIQQKRMVEDSHITMFMEIKSFEFSILKQKISKFFQEH